jgi:hypothetical protein
MRARAVSSALTRLLFVFLVAPLALVGCGFTEVHEVLLRPAVRAPEPVEIFVGGQNPQRPFYEVGLLQAIGHGSNANGRDATKALANRASRVGCDALVRVHVDQGYTMANVVGVCVRWVGSAPANPPPPPPPVSPMPIEPESQGPSPEAPPAAPSPSGPGGQSL